MIGDLIDNLNEVLDHVGNRDDQLSQLITTFRTFVGRAQGATARRSSARSTRSPQLSVQTADLVTGIRAPLRRRHQAAARASPGNLDRSKAELDRALQVLPIKLNKVGRTAIYGSWFNFYLCHFQGTRASCRGGTPLPVDYSTGSDRCDLRQVQSLMSVPFRERNPVIIGAISLAVIAVLILAAFRAQDLPLIGGGDTYYAAFSEAGGLKANDEVRIAGVRVGKVEKVELDGDHVKVTFRVDTSAEFGKETGAAIKVKTLLGAMYLALEPAGSGQLRRGREIPVDAHQLAVRRRRGLLRPGRDRRADRHRPAGQVADHPGRPDPQHPRGVPGRARRRLAAVGQHRGHERPDQHAAAATSRRSRGPRRPRPGHRRADEGLRRAVPGAGRPPRGGAQPARLDPHAVHAS